VERTYVKRKVSVCILSLYNFSSPIVATRYITEFTEFIAHI
jgi:hypothetical protein